MCSFGFRYVEKSFDDGGYVKDTNPLPTSYFFRLAFIEIF